MGKNPIWGYPLIWAVSILKYIKTIKSKYRNIIKINLYHRNLDIQDANSEQMKITYKIIQINVKYKKKTFFA